MSSNNFRLALDFYQSPAGHEALVDPGSPLPPEISFLLDMLAADRVERAPGLSDEMRLDIEFLLERVLFAPGGDYYRVLGLNRDATPELIRKHYNQLILIFFHGEKAEEWNAAYAMQINRAYSILRDSEKRRAYDLGVQYQGRTNVSRRPAMDPPRPATPTLQVEARIERGTDRASLTPARSQTPSSYVAKSIDRAHGGAEHLPAMPVDARIPGDATSRPKIDERIGAGKESFPQGIPLSEDNVNRRRPASPSFFSSKLNLALMGGVIVVVMLYIAMLPSMMQTSTVIFDEDITEQAPVESPAHVAEAETLPESLPPEPLMMSEQAAPPPAAELESPRLETLAGARQGPDHDVAAAAVRPPDPQPRGRAPEAPAIVTAPVVVASPASSPAEPAPRPQTAPVVSPPAEIATARPTLPPAPRIDVTPARAVATIQELDNLAVTFARAYETGNLELMLSLFAENARTNERTNKTGIRSDYEELFRVTDRREFVIDGLRWQQDRDGDLKGTGEFKVNVRFRDDQSLNTVTGNVVIRVEKRPQGIVITEFMHSYR